MSISKRDLYSLWRDENGTGKRHVIKEYVFGTLLSTFSLSENETRDIDDKIKSFVSRLNQKWKACRRNKNFFEKKNKEWLDTHLQFRNEPTSGQRAALSTEASEKLQIPFSPDEALAFFIDVGHTKRTYKLTRSSARKHNANIFPSYNVLRLAKMDCYPLDLKTTDCTAEVSLQNLVDHTMKRLIKAHPHIFEHQGPQQLSSVYNWGCGGSSGQFNDNEYGMVDQHLFTVCLVPLQVMLGTTILWKNERPSSTRYCRPLKLLRQKESTELITEEISKVKSQIDGIPPTLCKDYVISHKFHMATLGDETFTAISSSLSQGEDIISCVYNRNTMEDVMHYLLISSDPVITSLSKKALNSSKKETEETNTDTESDSDY